MGCQELPGAEARPTARVLIACLIRLKPRSYQVTPQVLGGWWMTQRAVVPPSGRPD